MKDITSLIKGLAGEGRGGKMYVLLGEEAQLIEEARAAIRRQFSHPRERADLESLADSPVAQNRGDALFGGGASLYEIVGHSPPPPNALAALRRLAARLESSADVYAVAIYGLTKKHYKAAWLRDLCKDGATAATASPLSSADAAAWCRRWLAEWEMKADDEGVARLAAQTEGNLAAAKQCLHLIRLRGGDCGTDDIAQALSGGARHHVFDLIGAAMEGKGKKSLAILNALLEIQEPPPLIAWALSAAAGGLLALKVGDYPGAMPPTPAMRETARAASEGRIIATLKKIAHADRIIKGIDQGDIKIALTDAAAALASLRRPKNISVPELQPE